MIDAFVPPQAPLGPTRLYVDGELLAVVGGGGVGAQRWEVPLACGDGLEGAPRLQPGGVLCVEMEVDTHRPGAPGGEGDARDLGLLVRRIALRTDARADESLAGAARPASWTVALAGLRCEPRAARTVGRGRVLPGDGSPLSALAWLSTWIDGSIAGLAPPDVARDPSRRLLVSALEGGRLEHEPVSQETRWVAR